MSDGLKVENNAAANNQTIINIQHMSGNIAVPKNLTYVLTEKNNMTDKSGATTISLNNEFYNLFVVGDETFESGRFTVPNGRMLNANPEIEEQYASLSSDAVAKIKKLPSLFMSENKKYGSFTEPDHIAYFGIVTDVRKERKQTIVVFKTLMELPQQAIIDLAIYLGIDNEGSGLTELNVTRWSIKRADLVSELRLAGFKVKTNPRGLLSSHEKIVSIPLQKNFYFMGRSEQLKELLIKLNDVPDGIPAKQIISGLGGVGKTQFALHFAYENIHNYDYVCWIECISEAAIIRSCENFLSQVGVASQNNTSALFTHWFQTHSNWLIIFDDVGFNSSVDNFLPKVGDGHILITTQQTRGDVIQLGDLLLNEAIEFVRKRTGFNDSASAESIAVRLGRFPLALEQAVAYINEVKIDLNEYLKLVNAYGLDVFDEEDKVERYNQNIKTVWNITLEKLSDTARQLLYCFAYMSSDIIALDWLIEHAKKLHAESEKPDEFINEIGRGGKPTGNKVNVSEIFRTFIVSKFSPDLIAILINDLKRNKAVIELSKYSLIKIKTDKTITMHGLLQEVIRKSITDPVYLLSVWEVMKAKRSDVGLIYNDYHIALPYEQAKAMILNAQTLLGYGKEYEAANNNFNIDMWELQFDFYSLFAQYLTLRGIEENDTQILHEADKCYATACEIGTPLYGGGVGSELLSGASTFTVIQEKHRRMKVNLILGQVDVAHKIYEEVRAPVSKSLEQERGMSFHAFNNFGDLWHEFGFFAEAIECYEFALEIGLSNEENTLLEKIANCKNGGSCNGK